MASSVTGPVRAQRLAAVFAIAISTCSLSAQDKPRSAPGRKNPTKQERYDRSVPKPTVASARYGNHERHVLGFWKADSPTPTPLVFVIHGGGWQGGSKERVQRFADVAALLKAGISVTALNYRYVRQGVEAGLEPPVKAPLYDAARALQFVRSKAKEWNIDKERIGAAGGSAGACSSLWLAFHDDLAESESDDPIDRESTRLWCAAVIGAQTTLDPKQMKEWTPNSKYGGHAFGLQGFPKFLAERENILPWIAEYSPYALVTKDDPPVFLQYSSPPALGKDQRDPTHTSNFGVKLQEHCKAHGVNCELVYPKAPGISHASTTEYLIATLKSAKRPAATSATLKNAGHQKRTIEGWTVHINRQLLEQEKVATERALELLTVQLREITRVVPEIAVTELRKVPLWFSPEYPGFRQRAEYHPGAAWLRKNNRDPVMAKAVEFTNIRIFERETKRMPNFALHELAHAYHDRVLPDGFSNGDIKEAFEDAKASGLYEKVERRFGNGRSSKERAYAMTNPMEYFAECTEAYFSTNDFFPFTRKQLQAHDPEMFALLRVLWAQTAVDKSASTEGNPSMAGRYSIVVSAKTHSNTEWKKVVTALKQKYEGADIVTFADHVREALPALRRSHPRFTCFVATSAEASRQFVADVHQMTRQFDDDPYADTLWGILTGYDAANALRIARHKEPLTVRKVASGTEVALDMCRQGVWYDELIQHKTVRRGQDGRIKESRGPADTTHALAETLTKDAADLFVTSGHATERDWQIGYRYRNGQFRSKAGRMYGVTTSGERFSIQSKYPKVYLPIGNCLMGHIDGPDAMALAWMNDVGVHQMIGYTVLTWYGYSGWGTLDYFVEQPGRYILTEAFHANQHALIHRLDTYYDDLVSVDLTPGGRDLPAGTPNEAGRSLGLTPFDSRGLLWDRDTVAFYGDPGWQARMAPMSKAYAQHLTIDGNLYSLTITPQRGSDSFKPVNKNGAQRGWRPVVELLDRRISNVKIIEGAGLNPVITDDFILVPNPRTVEPSREYRIRFTASHSRGTAEY